MDASAGIWAHTPNELGQWHDLSAHLTAVANMAKAFAEPFGGGEAGFQAGLWHDLGKFHPDSQGYLAACHRARLEGRAAPARSVDHKGAGATVAARYGGPLAFLVA